ncbi:hypothetical protein [Bacillus alkalicellulosilyticus]|uniref:hypothetical protein n=1 Tax=Alkalihalobacterium alkalicellulosilyticum TaxID=1912214 RepID=UPI000997FBB2|nr:hypothetical protein [Bacillus alkalicellulosilyticus]
MKEKYLRLLSLLLCICLLIALPLSSQAQDSITKKKVISLIYDDSGSMWFMYDDDLNQLPSDNWKFANYSLQSMIALLGEEDELSVVRMTEPAKLDTINARYENRQREINRVSSWEDRGWTPFETVDTATKHLMSAAEKEPDSEFWFIIVMDGVFNELDYMQIEDDQTLTQNYAYARERLEQFTSFMTEKDIKFNSILVTIESFLTEDERIQMKDFIDIWHETTGGLHITAENEQEIIERINEVAAIITNRDPNAEKSSVDLQPTFNGKDVTIYSPYPLKRITVLQQAPDQLTPVKVKSIGSNDYQVNGPFLMQTPYDEFELREDLFGGISHIAPKHKDGVIPQGEYTLTFDEDVSSFNPEDFHFIAEPAIDFHVSILREEDDGSYTSDLDTFFYGSDMVMEVELVHLGNEEQKVTFTASQAESDVEVIATIEDQTVSFTWDAERESFIGTFVMPDEDSEAEVTSLVHGFYQETKIIPLVGVGGRDLRLDLVTLDWRASLNELNEADAIQIQPYINDREITEEELAEVFETIQVSSNQNLQFDVTQNGSLLEIKPKQNYLPFLSTVGDVEVQVEMEGKYAGEYASTEFAIFIEDISWWQKYGIYLTYFLAIILFIIWLIGIIRKPRFAKNAAYVELVTAQMLRGREIGSYSSTEHFRTNFFSRWFVPYVPEKCTIQSVTFKATRNSDRVYLAKESQTEEMVVQYQKLEHDSGRQDLLIYSNDVIELEIYNQKEKYTYIKN